ncbi:MAG: NAD-dependent epimerase/dehydratase family protein [Candidatus Doudnabacteria bacterium]|nr:NAD-dependent epimerase/dehydratase family protein [Candidatus Doudnabacteria bacterium]
MNQNFWSGKKVLITGAHGFVGSSLTKSLLAKGATVIALSKNPSSVFEGVNGDLIQVKLDVLNYDGLLKTITEQGVDTIFHLAASAIVSKALLDPLNTLQNNILGTLNLLEAARCTKVKRMVIASSDKAYGDHAEDELEKLPYKESYGLHGLDIYSASKVSGDVLAQAYAFQYTMPVMIARCCNIYGPGDVNFTRLIPRTAMLLLSNQPPVIKAGHEKVLREYIYIDDVVNAYLFLAENTEKYYGQEGVNMPKKGRATIGWPAFNVGSYTEKRLENLSDCDNIRSVTQVIKSLREEIKNIEPLVVSKQAQYVEIPDEYLNSSKLSSLGFQSQTNFSEGIKKTVSWYKENYEKFKNNFLNS